MIRGLEYVSVPAADWSAALRFYGEVLGLPLAFERAERWAEFRAGSFRLAVYPEEDEGRGGEIGFLVDDLEGEIERLREGGVDFPHGIEPFDLPTGRGRLARFKDPSGNRLELVERR